MTFPVWSLAPPSNGDSESRSAERPAKPHLTLLRRTASPEAADDRVLAERIRDGDHAAVRVLFERYASRLTRFAARLVHDGAEDIVQDAFVNLWTHRDRLDPERSIRALLYSIVHSRAVNAHHRHVRERHWQDEFMAIGESPFAGTIGAPEMTIEREELARVLAAAFAALPVRTRQTALLRWRDQLSRPEIAEVMGIAVSTVNNQLTHAARVLRSLLSAIAPGASHEDVPPAE